MLGSADITCSAQRIATRGSSLRFLVPDKALFLFFFFYAVCRQSEASASRAWHLRFWAGSARRRAVSREARGRRRAFAVLTLGPTSMATCLLHCRPRDGEAPCAVAQRLRYGMFLPPPPMGRHAGRARAVGVLVAERPRTPCPPVGPGKHSGRRVCVRWAMRRVGAFR